MPRRTEGQILTISLQNYPNVASNVDAKRLFAYQENWKSWRADEEHSPWKVLIDIWRAAATLFTRTTEGKVFQQATSYLFNERKYSTWEIGKTEQTGRLAFKME